MATLSTTVRDDTLTLSTDLAQAGAVFNDSTRLIDGGLWKSPADRNNQIACLGMYTTGNALAADQAQVLAAGQGFVADASEVSGNNIPIAGGNYVGPGAPRGGQGGNGQRGQGNGGQANQGGGPIASRGDDNDGGDPCRGHGDAGEHDSRPVPSFWNFAEDKHGHQNGGRHHFERTWHHA